MIDEALSEKEHWEETWKNISLPRVIDINDRGLLELHEIFNRCLNNSEKKLDLLEVGCAASAWLPYFHKYHHCTVYGVDYSPVGVQLARKNLSLQGVDGEIILGDILLEERIFNRQFDVIVSFGFIEHFLSPDKVIKKMATYLRSGGLLVTTVPNLKGIFGWFLRRFQPDLFNIHYPMDLEELTRHHERAGLFPYDIPGYVGGIDLKMLASTVVKDTWPRLIKAGIATTVYYLNPLAMKILARLRSQHIPKRLAPDVFVIFKKKDES